MTNETTQNKIQERLHNAFNPRFINVDDESHLHAGHAGAQSGKGHYAVEIHSEAFAKQTLIARHKMVYEALGELMETEIHALSIKATP